MSTLFWGANFNVGKFVVEYLPPTVAAALRFSLASIVILIIVYFKEKQFKMAIKENFIMYLLLGFIGVAGFNGFFFLGLKFTSSFNGALIMATNPILTASLAVFILKDSFNKNLLYGMLLSLFGVLIIVTNGSLSKLMNLQISVGDYFIMLGNICWALYCVLCKRFLKNSKPLITTAMTMLSGTILLILLAYQDFNLTELISLPYSVYMSIFYMSIFGAVLAYLFWNMGVNNLGVGKTSIWFNMVPVFTVIISLIMGQSFYFIQIIGGFIVILGVIFSLNFFNFKKVYKIMRKSFSEKNI
ncbi:hypothetical protein AXG55_12480 [Silvanigrella aquatica]|uniref:EamA domain-containing protein n=2 Tax=Silvanigrella aquatica TaxID=1915309 RepID=A0A1L4D4T1_9BACT|nr:hypothetical protein AXG55_12480 [Silvanigrella aquatica]